MMSNTAIWDTLGKTDPEHTKKFSRSGGFKGTAVKPMWVYHRLTEQFGPVGIGWGHNRPDFQVVPGADGEMLVYCTVECWHTDRANTFHGVGGDKITTKRQSGHFNDDEAFKKAFTDGVMNAFKSVGVAADVHMGLHDDDKYVEEMRQEFTPKASEPPQELPTGPINDKTRDWVGDQVSKHSLDVGDLCRAMAVTSLKALTYEQMDDVKSWLKNNRKAA